LGSNPARATTRVGPAACSRRADFVLARSGFSPATLVGADAARPRLGSNPARATTRVGPAACSRRADFVLARSGFSPATLVGAVAARAERWELLQRQLRPQCELGRTGRLAVRPPLSVLSNCKSLTLGRRAASLGLAVAPRALLPSTAQKAVAVRGRQSKLTPLGATRSRELQVCATYRRRPPNRGTPNLSGVWRWRGLSLIGARTGIWKLLAAAAAVASC